MDISPNNEARTAFSWLTADEWQNRGDAPKTRVKALSLP
jgi:hypothetical protein